MVKKWLIAFKIWALCLQSRPVWTPTSHFWGPFAKKHISQKKFFCSILLAKYPISNIFFARSRPSTLFDLKWRITAKNVFFGSNFVILENLSPSPTKRVQMWSKMIRPAYCPQNIDDFVFLNHLNIFSGLWVMCNLVMVGVFVIIIFSWKKSCFWSNIPYFTPSEHKKLSSLEC